jgi:hypothetical protein
VYRTAFNLESISQIFLSFASPLAEKQVSKTTSTKIPVMILFIDNNPPPKGF